MIQTSELKKLTWNLVEFRVLWVAVFVMTFWMYCKIIKFLSHVTWSTRKPNAAVFFGVYHEKIRKVFRCQREETLGVLMAGVDRVMRGGGGDNTVLLFLAAEGATCTAHRLATLLTHCILVGYQRSADVRSVKTVTVDGAEYSQDHADWKFFIQMRRLFRRHGVVTIVDAQKLHPYVLRRMITLCSPIFNSSHMSVIILVMDVDKRFTNHQLMTTSANSLGKIFLEELLTPYPRDELVNLLTARSVLVLPELNVPSL